MSAFVQPLLFVLALLSTLSCSQNSDPAPKLEKFSMQEPASENAENKNAEENIPRAIPRAIPVEDAGVQELANTMVGKPADDRFAATGVYKKWSTGGRGFYNPANRKLYESFAENSLTGARNETTAIYYPFGGPDVIYPLTFFPRAKVLILVGIEAIGNLPSYETAQSDAYQESMDSMMEIYLGSSFYRTQDMRAEANANPNSATWAKMMAAIALLDLKILTTETGTLTEEGVWRNDAQTPVAERHPMSPKGVVFRCLRNIGGRSEIVAIYYFQQNLGESNWDSLKSLPKATPFRKFVGTLKGNYTSFLKAASFLSHDTGGFKISNEMVFGGNRIVQAPSGVPFSEFVKRRDSWKLVLFGDYRQPSETFAKRHQSDLQEAYRGAIEKDRRAEYADFVTYGGDLPFHYDYGTGTDGRGKGSMLFYGVRSKW